MLPLKASVNALQNALRYSDCLVRASPFLDGRLERHHAGLILEEPSDRFDVELPEFGYFGRRIVAFVRSGCFRQIAKISKYGKHRYLPRLSISRSHSKRRSLWAT